jgi:tRNA U34 2-thiouridine synthase MnmA/TrmU
MKKIQALAMFSGGLDSILAIKIIKDQGIEVEAFKVISPFCQNGVEEGRTPSEIIKKLGVKLHEVPIDHEYLLLLKNPKHKYGQFLNPCIDCRIYMLKKAKDFADKKGFGFIITGEVLGQRPMSQQKAAIELIEKESGLRGKILRPLTALNLPETDVELNNSVDRAQLLDIKGRSRKKQIELAQKFGITNYPSPAGGCLLTCKEFSAKLKDLFQYRKHVSSKDISLLKVGRHFRYKENKIIVGRNEEENKDLLSLKRKRDYYLEAVDCGSPVTILQGPKTKDAVKLAARLTARYSDCVKQVKVKVRNTNKKEIIQTDPLLSENIEKLRIKW